MSTAVDIIGVVVYHAPMPPCPHAPMPLILTLALGGKLAMDIEKAKERHKKLGESIRKFEQAQNKKERTKETRRKILIGAAMMSAPEQYDKFVKSDLFNKYLTENRDRDLFGLPLFPESETPKKKGPKAEGIKNEEARSEADESENSTPDSPHVQNDRFAIKPDSPDL
jgi:hypothetical protein